MISNILQKKADVHFLISKQDYTIGKLLEGTKC